ncbi:hypothetical protein [Pseudomonas bubulae]|uniref:hypothetical protein n=1 Tax=Pseudomonas bubulae TaxID=2316085 RepID=UPI0011B5D899|nr:hypothetical protein [Pseudomonas bubulae]
MDSRLSAVLACLAFALSSVTAISVAMTVYSLIDDPFLRLVFAGAAVLLDAFKYLAWPVAMRLINERLWLAAAGLLFCSITLGAVSGWSTYDRLVGSINASHSLQEALAGARAAQLTALIKTDSDFLENLGEAEKKTNSESSALRDKGMVTKAQELESAAYDRTDTQRLAAMERIKTNSQEIADIQAAVAKASSIPALLAALLCAGFALSLELVPALILAILPSQKPEVIKGEDVPESTTTVPAIPETAENHELVSNNSLLETLLKQASELPMHSKIKVKDFAIENRVGNLKACQAFKKAEELGVIKKTRLGWVIAHTCPPICNQSGNSMHL